MAIHRVPAHAEVGRIDLHQEARGDDRLVFAAQRFGHRFRGSHPAVL